MRFSYPYWLLAGLLTCVALIGLWRRYDARQRAALAEFVAPHLRSALTGSVSRAGRIVQRGLFLGAVGCLFTALAGPLIGYHWERISRRGNEVVFAIDTSRSMLTPDVKPNRLTRAKLAVDDMASQLEGDGIGIVAFAGSAFLVCPLTLDYGAFHESLDAVDTHTIPHGGTNISSAILEARAALRRRPGSDRILILVTDGENLEGDALAAATQAARQDGLKIYTVGIGTAGGDLIPLPADQGGGFVKDETGAFVKSHLDEAALKEIASATGGAYVHLGGQGEDFEVFLRTVFGAVSQHDLVYRQRRIYTERYQWPLAASFVLLLASLMVGTRRARRRRPAAIPRAVAVSAVMGVLAVPVHVRSNAQTVTGGGKSNAEAPVVEYNAGTNAYRAGQFARATQSFEKSVKLDPASDPKRLADQEDAYYNLGNALYRAGQQFEKSAPQEAIGRWTEALKAYDTALQLRADDADSKYNRDFVQRKIDALRQPPNQGGGGGQGGQGGGAAQGSPPKSPPRGSQSPPQGSPPRPPPQPPPQGSPPQLPPPAQHAAPRAAAPGQAAAQGTPRPAPSGSTSADPPSADDDEKHVAENQRAPGEMSVEEARELLDSAKSEERRSLGVPSGPRDPDHGPDKPFKDW